MILRVLSNTGAVSSDQVEQHLRDIIGMFNRSGAAEAERLAAAHVSDILENVSSPLP